MSTSRNRNQHLYYLFRKSMYVDCLRKYSVDSTETAKTNFIINKNGCLKKSENLINENKSNLICKEITSDNLQIKPIQPITNTITKSNKENNNLIKHLNNNGVRFNRFNIQMISKNLYAQLFGNSHIESNNISEEVIQKYTKDLKNHNLLAQQEEASDIDLNLPKFDGQNLIEHFWKIGESQSGPYRKLLEDLIKEIPDMPVKWSFEPGWTRYTVNGSEKVDFPLEDGVIFDIEVCLNEGDMPTLATAVSRKAWYGWVSPDLVNINKKRLKKTYTTDQLIPFESDSKVSGYNLKDTLKRPKIVVGHNVSFDRARIKEQYWLEKTGLRFMDTMSMHISVSGVTSYQKALLKSKTACENDWSNFSSLNSLSKVHQLYCGCELSKEMRDTFISGTLEDVHNEFQLLIKYCADDVVATHNILSKLLPMYLSRFPHPVTLAGMLEIGSAYLPVNLNWKRYIDAANNTYNDLENETKYLLTQRANHACQLLHNEEYKNDLWLWDQDWSVRNLTLKKSATKTAKKKKKVIDEESLTDKEIDENPMQDSGEKNTKETVPYLLLKEIQDKEESIKAAYNDLSSPFIDNLKNKFEYLMKTKELLPVKLPLLPGYPAWYRKLCTKPNTNNWIPGPNLISTSMQISPKLLSLTWKSMPLHYIRGYGWGYLVPYETEIKLKDEDKLPKQIFYDYCINVNSSILCNCQINAITEKNNNKIIDKVMLHENVQTDLVRFTCNKGFIKNKQIKKKLKDENANDKKIINDVFCKAKIHYGKCGFIKLPHKNGIHLNVGNPLAKDFVYKFSDNELGSSDEQAKKIINISRMLSYWRNHSDRVKEQIVVWLNKKDLPLNLRNRGIGAILPQVIVSGTLTRRAVERTWMTASNAVDERVGSELRAMIQAPPGYSIIGADVDAQELWIASVIGDAYSIKEHGATPFGWMTLSGQKSNGTDMHSVTAKAIGITRTHAKIINYARIYGAGQPFAERLLKQFNPDMTYNEAREKARKMFAMTKGMRVFRLKEKVLPGIKKRVYSRYAVREICALHNKSVEDLFESPKWSGGSESAMFNCLEEIASNDEPKTPFLSCRLSRALEPIRDIEDRFIPTRINWVVQSGAVDFLHLMLVCMRWLLGDEPRFCLSFHDEIRYIVKNNMKYEAALALHVTNLLVRAFCVQRLGMVDLPRSVAFFSSVEVDTVLRKEANNDCITPSNPYGLSKGYGVPLGESLNIDEAIRLANGIIGIHQPNKIPKKTVKK